MIINIKSNGLELITQNLGLEYAIYLKGTQLIGVHEDVMGMND